MAVREFNGSSDYIHLGGTGVALADIANAYSLLALVKTISNSTLGTIISCARTTNVDCVAELWDGGSGTWNHRNYLDGDCPGQLTGASTSWQLIGVDKAAGDNVNPRFHQIIQGGGTSHVNSTISVGSQPTDLWTLTQFGRRGTGTAYKNYRIAVAAVFNKQLTDANYVSVGSALTTASIAALGPVALWEFNQAAVTTAIEDLIGSADQVARSGTTVVTGDDPTWTFGLGVTLDTVLPDADITTTGWSTAPLYSKLNDSSDATVIQATAS